jgi:hypothetical protein
MLSSREVSHDVILLLGAEFEPELVHKVSGVIADKLGYYSSYLSSEELKKIPDGPKGSYNLSHRLIDLAQYSALVFIAGKNEFLGRPDLVYLSHAAPQEMRKRFIFYQTQPTTWDSVIRFMCDNNDSKFVSSVDELIDHLKTMLY